MRWREFIAGLGAVAAPWELFGVGHRSASQSDR